MRRNVVVFALTGILIAGLTGSAQAATGTGATGAAAAANPRTAPGGVVVSAGYADSTGGITPWLGSPGTTFIGELAQCCSTHGSNNGSVTYDGGAVEVANTTSAPITVNGVTVYFGGGSTPGQFALWGGGGSGRLPLTLGQGQRVVMTMTSGFNFDTSDLLGEACHVNTLVVPVVNVTVDGATTSYQDDHQILNSDGVDLSSCPGVGVAEQHPFVALRPGAQPAAGPVSSVAPVVTGPAVRSRILSALAGGWSASPPPQLSAHWVRCNRAGQTCTRIAGATGWTYVPRPADVGRTLRVRVTALNASGTRTVSSRPSALIADGPVLAHLGNTYPGFTSTLVTSAVELGSVFTARHNGTSADFEFFGRGAGSTQQFTPRIYSIVNGQQGQLLRSGPTVSVPRGSGARWHTSVLSGLQLVAGQSYELALASSGAGSGTYIGVSRNGTYAFFLDYRAM